MVEGDTLVEPRISVVILGQQSDGLPLTIDAIRRGETSGIEVLVVRGEGFSRGDDHEAIPSDVKHVSCNESSLAAACNEGLRAAAGDLVAFVSTGWYPGPTWLKRLSCPFADDEVAASGGPVLGPDGVTVAAACWIVDSFAALSRSTTVPPFDYWSSPFSDVSVCPIPGNSIFRRARLVEVGGFDERYAGPLAFVDVCRRLLDRGWVVRPIAVAAVFQHSHASGESIGQPSDANDIVLYGLTHALPRHSFADVARRVASLEVVEPAADEAKDLDRGFEQWKQSPAGTRRASWLDDAGPAFVPCELRRPARRRLHVCYVAQEWLPVHNGVARLVHARASGLAARGHLVRVLTMTEDALSVALEDGIWVHRIPTTDHPPPDVIMPPRLWNRSASVLDELVRISEDQAIDVVDVPNWDVEGYATIIDGRFRTVLGLHSGVAAYVATDARFSADDPIVQEVLDAERTCYQQADAFIAATDAIVAEIEQGFDVTFPRHRLALVPHGLPQLDPASESGSPAADDRELEVLFVGRLEARKGIDTLLEAIPIVLEATPDVRFTIVGDDTISSPRGSTFRREFEHSPIGQRLADRVTFTGIVDDDELTKRYELCDVFVAPSRFESFGLILLEAMRLGKPVVAGDAGGMREVIGDDGAGILVEPGDPEALARVLISLLRDTDLRGAVGAAGRRRFDERFTLERMTAGIEAFFLELVQT